MGDFKQFKTGTLDNGASATIVFDEPTEAGNTIVVIGGSGLNSPTGGVGFAAPTGGAGSFSLEQPWNGAGSSTSRVKIEMWAQKNVAAGETTYTFPAGGSTNTGIWVAMEVTGLLTSGFNNEPIYYSTASVGADDTVPGLVSTVTSPSVPSDFDSLATTRFYKSLGLSAFMANNASSTPAISNYSADQNELVQVSLVAAAGQHLTLAVTYRKHYDLGSFSASADVSPASHFTANEAIWADADSRHAPIFDVFTGFEMGTANGLTAVSSAAPGTAPFDASAGTPEIVSTFKRTGNYALKLSSSAAAEWVSWTDPGVLSVYRPVKGDVTDYVLNVEASFYFDGSLPSADLDLFSIEAGSTSNAVKVRFVQSSGKIGVKIGAGSEVLSDAAVSANKWFQIVAVYNPTLTTHTCDWQIRYDSLDSTTRNVAQSQASTSGMTAAHADAFVLGWKTSSSGTVYVDDVAVCKQYMPYPLTDIRIEPLLPDQTGTPTISGTTSNFQTYASNGVGTAWNANTARAALDDMPPVVGASADGIMQVNSASGDYVEVPMETLVLGQTKSQMAVRWYVPIWAASGTAATLGVQASDGSNTLFNVAAADHGQDSSSTLWLCGMHRLVNSGGVLPRLWQLTKARLDALSLRFGFSTDANPDVGIHAILAEVAWTPPVDIVVMEAYDDLSGLHRVYQRLDPNTNVTVGFLVATPNDGRGGTFTWTVDGVENSHYVLTNSTWALDLNLDQVSQLTAWGYSPDMYG